jgi:hypothetical protein
MNIQNLRLDTIVPYWRNPRKNDVAVEKVKKSIEEYGYVTPIVVDTKLTIIAGHTRYRALKELGYDEVPVIITDLSEKKAKEFRIIDNRTSEYATWTPDLNLELKEFSDPEVLNVFFPDVQLDPDFAKATALKAEESIEEIAADLERRFQEASEQREREPKLTIPCPHCSEEITFLRKDLLADKNWAF